MSTADIRNLAIIAHVDHGKTTLVDGLLAAAGALERRNADTDRALDSNDLERERGITITSKPTALVYGDTRINLVDTPGHADFGGEVERVLNMVDAALLVVDAFEGPMPQTRFVTEKAVAAGLRILLVVNKIDRPGCDPHSAVDATFDLLASLDASEEQLDFPVIFTSARERYAKADPDDAEAPMTAVLDFICEHAPQPRCAPSGGFAMWVSTLDYDNFLGYVAIGRVQSGSISVGDRVALIRPQANAADPEAEPKVVEVFRARKLLGFQGLRRFERETVEAGDIVAISGMESLAVGDTMTTEEPSTRTVFPPLSVDPPTMAIRIRINDGPFAGREGKWVTSRKIAERLQRELRSNVALQVAATDTSDEFEVAGRGELHLSVLIETMRREGYELCVSRPRVILREGPSGTEEPFERLTINCDAAYTGAIIEKLGQRGGEMVAMKDASEGRTAMEFIIPTRSLIGYRSEMLTDTRGTGVMASTFSHYGPYQGARKSRSRGVLVVMDTGETNTYSLHRLQDRGTLFLGPQTPVYAGQIIGEHCRENDLVVNPCVAKKLTNVRSTGHDDKLFLTPPTVFSLEQNLAYLDDDELLEVTPESMRLRKRLLDHNARKRDEKSAALG
ncbi:MAG: translational GTPase TypA [Nannocystaceae bacterium]